MDKVGAVLRKVWPFIVTALLWIAVNILDKHHAFSEGPDGSGAGCMMGCMTLIMAVLWTFGSIIYFGILLGRYL